MAGRPRLSTGRAYVWAAVVVLAAAGAEAQGVAPGPPGPFVIDVRGASTGVPQAFGFYPDIPPETLVPARGFGVEAGAHVYFGRLGPARLGAGASYIQARGTSGEEIAATVRVLAPQLSFNFGTSRGWSYVSGGVGVAQVSGRRAPVEPGEAPASRGSGPLPALNVGGGARWFFTPRVAFTFDLRLHRVGAQEPDVGTPGTPASMLGAASVGLSFK